MFQFPWNITDSILHNLLKTMPEIKFDKILSFSTEDPVNINFI